MRICYDGGSGQDRDFPAVSLMTTNVPKGDRLDCRGGTRATVVKGENQVASHVPIVTWNPTKQIPCGT